MRNYKLGGIILLIIFLTGCASTVPETKLMPRESDNVFPFFKAGQPIAAVQSTNAFMLLSMDRTILAQQPFFRLWILYQNNSEEPYLLEPLRFVSLNVTSIAQKKMGTSTPQSPTKILAALSNEKALSMIVEAIGGTLQEMAAQPTSAKTKFNDGSSTTTTFNDQHEKREQIADRTTNSMANTAMWYDIYRNSLSDGILRRNTVFPGQSVNGYIFFPFPGIKKSDYKENANISSDVKYFLTVEMDLSGEKQTIDFTPIEGE
jgi:hypothetical protein